VVVTEFSLELTNVASYHSSVVKVLANRADGIPPLHNRLSRLTDKNTDASFRIGYQAAKPFGLCL